MPAGFQQVRLCKICVRNARPPGAASYPVSHGSAAISSAATLSSGGRPAAGCGGGSGAGLSGSGRPAAGGEGLGGSSGGGQQNPVTAAPGRPQRAGSRSAGRAGAANRAAGLYTSRSRFHPPFDGRRRSKSPPGPPLLLASLVAHAAAGRPRERASIAGRLRRGDTAPPGPPEGWERGEAISLSLDRDSERPSAASLSFARLAAGEGDLAIARSFPPLSPPQGGGACGARARSRLRARPVFSCF
jgi:hypothetical protein